MGSSNCAEPVTQDGYKVEQIEKVPPVLRQEMMLPAPTSAWPLHLLCTDGQTKSLAVATSYGTCQLGKTAVTNLDYLRTRLDSQIGGTNRAVGGCSALHPLCRMCTFPWYVGGHF